MRRLAGRIAVVTGAGSGIGRATARELARRRARVHVVDIDRARAEAVAEELARTGAEAWAHEVDVRDAAAVEALAERVYAQHGRTDVLVNNAGIGFSAHVHEMSLDDWRAVLDVNLHGVIHGVHAFVPRMIDQGGDAHIVNVASILGLLGVPTMSAYCASKFAIVGLSECLGAELAPFGIAVTTACPGVIATDIVRAARMGASVDAHKRRIVELYRRVGIAPDRVARDIVRAVMRAAPLALTLGGSYPALLLHRFAPRLYRRFARIAHDRMLGGAQR
jgi:NAD(P)-dependent dehydrogenase (short-subunit alcohol dehydrogenase family)